ncbi:Hsp20 family protein [Gammaproteobacteria bacterium]|jgi:molecular chaperone IbpA|nr:Hsp20 family protein [Gammaproteobacteria bacterium]MEC8315078.1 Hsp20 family protein [Pseudomonadota bacterium]MEC8449093.1 Hsp20 family protein [Pseudomonadota bacterium]MEC8798237.1 Hsp20 family protein [Pseudomonadota bacterium]|tara:strand:+ start:236 stop:685 length:450 start_codon:yes stop_codon:yes gene_type:complete
MINNTFDLLWRDISPFTIGFDRTFDTLALLANSKQQTSNYPPYNIRKLSEDKYTIELAVAGFEESEIDIEAAGENLTIKGSKDQDASEGLVHQGLAARNFNKTFVLSDDMVIKGAALSNGMLYIGIERIIPEDKKPRKIDFTSKSKLLG